MSVRSLAGSSPDGRPRAGAVIVAAGAGRRVGGEVRKQYLEIGGEPVVLRAVRPFVRHAGVGAVVVVLPAADAAEPPPWLAELGVTIVAGGAERGDSVWNGIAALPTSADPVLIHDGARPFVTAAVIGRVLAAVGPGTGAIAALPVADTIKEVDAEGGIVATPERARLWLAQTPQGFPRSMIVAAHQRARAEGVAASDDAALCERYGYAVRVVEGAAENLKITRAADLAIAAALVSRTP